MSNLLDQINQLTSTKPLIYFCREVERSLSLINLVKNYHICSIEDDYIVDELTNRGRSVFCLDRVKAIENKSVFNLLDEPATIAWLNEITKGQGFYAMTLYPSDVVNYKITKLGGQLLNAPYSLNKLFENKISLQKLAKDYSLNIPPAEVDEVQKLDFKKLTKTLGNNLIIQTAKGHTGNGTHFIDTKEKFEYVQENLKGNKVKVSKEIKGLPLTINGCIIGINTIWGPFQYQLTGIEPLTNFSGATVGNDFEYGANIIKEVDPETIKKLTGLLNSISLMLIKNQFKGLFGVDIIYDKEAKAFYLIEVNARQTANIPLQTALEIQQLAQDPMILFHLGTFLSLNIENEVRQYKHFSKLSGSQIFLRAKRDNQMIDFEPKSGIYKLQSDNAALDWKTGSDRAGVIYIDEEKDKPLIYQAPGITLADVQDGGFIVHFQRKGNLKRKTDELCRMQFKSSVIFNGSVSPWILEAMRSIERMISI